MDAIKSFGTTICFAALAAGMAGMIAPSGKLEKVYKFAISIFLLCCLLMPLFSLKNVRLQNVGLGDARVTANSSLDDTVSRQAESIAEQNVAQMINDCCKSCGITPVSVKTSVTSSDGTFAFQSAQVMIRAEDAPKAEKLKETVMNRLGINITIREGEK